VLLRLHRGKKEKSPDLRLDRESVPFQGGGGGLKVLSGTLPEGRRGGPAQQPRGDEKAIADGKEGGKNSIHLRERGKQKVCPVPRRPGDWNQSGGTSKYRETEELLQLPPRGSAQTLGKKLQRSGKGRGMVVQLGLSNVKRRGKDTALRGGHLPPCEGGKGVGETPSPFASLYGKKAVPFLSSRERTRSGKKNRRERHDKKKVEGRFHPLF